MPSAFANFSPSAPPWPIRHDRPGFLRICTALVLCGATAFSALYFVQPLLPVFVSEFGVTETEAGLSISLTTLALTIGLLIVGPVSDRFGRKPVILVSTLMTAAFLGAMCLVTHWVTFLALRAGLGLMLGGITAIVLTYLSEEMADGSLGQAIGYVLAGNSIGGMCARLVIGSSVDHIGWRVPLAGLALVALMSAVLLWRWLPRSRNFKASKGRPATLMRGYVDHLKNPDLRGPFVQAFLLMAAFVGFFNAVGFYLLSDRFVLGQTAVGLISIVFLPSTMAAIEAGRAQKRLGARNTSLICIGFAITGVALTLATWLPATLPGVLLFTLGFFGAHSVAAGQVGQRAGHARGQATALYQISFYAGATLSGVLVGAIWRWGGWYAVSAYLVVLLAATGCVAVQSGKAFERGSSALR